jgi:hypothetical protein
MGSISELVAYIRNPGTPHRAGPKRPGDAEEGMLVPSGIMQTIGRSGRGGLGPLGPGSGQEKSRDALPWRGEYKEASRLGTNCTTEGGLSDPANE